MDCFPAFLTAHYQDLHTTQSLTFTPDERADFTYTLDFQGQQLCFDDLYELLAQLPPEGRLHFGLPLDFLDRNGVHAEIILGIDLRRDISHSESIWFQCSCTIGEHLYQSTELSDGASGFASECGLEGALLDLHKQIQAIGYFCICFFCKFSDYEPSTSLGHLYCFVRSKAAYCQYAASDSKHDKKYSIWNLSCCSVDEFYSCGACELRPEKWGYRG